MSILIGSGANAVNWETLLGKIGDVTKTTNAEGKETLTLTMKVGEGTKTYTFGVPDDLELPAKVDAAAIDSLCSKLLADKDMFNLSESDIKTLKDNLTAVLADVSGAVAPNSKSVMFDLYKLLALLVEVAQKQRDAAREMRQAESAQVQTSIQNQANDQRTAAVTGLIAGALCCAVQCGFMGVALVKQSKAYTKQLDTTGTSGLGSAKQNLTMLKTANSPEAASRQLANVQSSVADQPSGVEGRTVQQVVNDGFATSRNAEQAFASAKSQLQETIEQRQVYEAMKANPDEIRAADLQRIPDEEAGQIKIAAAKLDTYRHLMEMGHSQQDIDAYITSKKNFANLGMEDRVRLMEFETNHPDFKGLGDKTLNELKADLNSALEAKVEQLRTAEANGLTAVENARVAYRDAVKADIQRFENEYEIARHEVNEITKDTPPAEAEASRAKLTATEAKLKLARAEGFNKLAKAGVTTENEYFQDVRDANEKVLYIDNNRQNTAEYKEAQHIIDKANTAISVTNLVGNAVQSMINHVTQWMQSEATRKGAEQEKAQEELSQTKDLFEQAQSLVDSVVQLMRAISEAESQSMRDAIQA